MPGKVENLIVDTSAFIKNAQLQELGENVISVEDVVNEIKSKRQLKRLVVLPYDLKLKDVFTENIKFVTEFSKKTGDYPSLSATDIKVIALAYQMEKELVGLEHLKSEPEMKRSVEFTDHSLVKPTDIAGFYLPKKNKKTTSGENSDEEDDECFEEFPSEEGDVSEEEEVYEDCLSELPDKIENIDIKDNEDEIDDDNEQDEKYEDERADEVEGIELVKLEETESSGEDFSSSEDEDDDSGFSHGWITPQNVRQAKKDVSVDILEEKPVRVACLTTDFAMQNVLKQIGLNVLSLDGFLINQLRTYILRCYACFKTTSVMTKVFCPTCGNKTLKRVAVTVDSNGEQRIHINLRRPLTSRGKKYSLPKPQGGKHAVNPVLCEDQRLPQQRLTKLAKTKTNALDPDYIAGFSPFAMRDINSKSIMLGHHLKGDVKYWMRRNPNEVVKHRKKK